MLFFLPYILQRGKQMKKINKILLGSLMLGMGLSTNNITNESVVAKQQIRKANSVGNLNIVENEPVFDVFYKNRLSESLIDYSTPGVVKVKSVKINRDESIFDSTLCFQIGIKGDVRLDYGELDYNLEFNLDNYNHSPRLRYSYGNVHQQFSTFASNINTKGSYSGTNANSFTLQSTTYYDVKQDLTIWVITFPAQTDTIVANLTFNYGKGGSKFKIQYVSLLKSNTNVYNSSTMAYSFYNKGNIEPSFIGKEGDDFYVKVSQGEAKQLAFYKQQLFLVYLENNKWMNITYKDDGNYSANCSSGLYVPSFYVVDPTTNEKTEIKLKIYVSDTEPPVISFKNISPSYAYYEENILEKVKENVLIEDFSGIKSVEYDISEEELHTLGKHEVNIKATDIYDNTSENILVVEIYDDKSPIITGYDLLRTTTDKVLTIDEILKMYKSLDEIDKECPITVIKNEYHKESNSSTPGMYSILLGSVDKSNNSVTKNIQIEVVEPTKEPIYYLTDGKLTVVKGTKLEYMEIVSKLQELGYIAKDTTYVNCFRLEGYEIDGTNELGSFNLTLQAEKENGDFDVIELEVTVIEEQKTESNGSSSNYSTNSFIRFFQKLFESIKKFFMNLFRR